MALTLRELLDKQRAEREARESAPFQQVQEKPVATAPSPVEQEHSGGPKPLDTTELPQVPPSPAKKTGMFSKVAGVATTAAEGQTNVTQGQTTGSQTQIATETKQTEQATASRESSPARSGLQNGNGTLSSAPALTGDETETLRKNLAFLAANLDEKEIIGQVLRTTVKQIQDHPELNAVMIDSDFDLIVAAARRSMKFVARKKEEKSDKRAAKQSQKDELEAFLKDQGIEL